MQRSKEKITKRDLRKLLHLARGDVEAFFDRNPAYSMYRNKECLIALCQGSALHFLDGKNGVKDFDVWFFYPDKGIPLPFRRRGVVDFGESKFGVHPKAKQRGYTGRTVDVLMRSDAFFTRKRPELAITNYLESKKSKTSQLLSQKAVVALYPESLFGKALWPAPL